MIPASDLIPHAEYVKAIRPHLPEHVFLRNPWKLVGIAGHLVLIAICIWLFRSAESLWSLALLSVVIGHSGACLGFYAHDLSHKTILPGGLLLRVLETLVWTVVAVPATVWRRVHNHTHHHETNTSHDPDRWFLVSEKSPASCAYTQVFYPNRDGVKFNPLVGLHFIAYVIRNTLAAIGADGSKPALVPVKPKYKPRQKLAVILESVLILVYQAIVFWAVGGSWGKYIWASPVAYAVTSAVVMAYIFTNHSLNELCEHTDPVAGSTSVEVLSWLNMLHVNFSYHTEHHLFPGMDSSQYPKVAKVLRAQFPDRYNRLRMGEAWHRLWKQKGFME